MANDNKETAAPSTPEQPPFADRKRNLLTIVVVGGLMLFEGLGIFMGIKFLGSEPEQAEASDGVYITDEDGIRKLLPHQMEVKVADLVAFNTKTGRAYVYQISVYADVETKHMESLRDVLEFRENTIEDRLSQVVRGCDPKYLEEPGLETIRRQFKRVMDDIVGSELMINEILLPQFSKQRAD